VFYFSKRLLVSMVLIWLGAGSLLADQSFDPGMIDLQSDHFADRITVQFKTNLLPENLEKLDGKGISLGLPTFDALLNRHGIYEMHKVFDGSTRPERGSDMNDLTVFYTMRIPQGVDLMAAITDFGFDENIIWAGPVYIYSFSATPNDPEVTQQFWLPNTTHAMKVYSAWDTNVGDSTIIFGDMDTGVNYRHPDLINNIWVNPGEDMNHNGVVFDSADLNGVDNDGNGKIDDLIGWDFVTSTTGGTPACYSAVGEDCAAADKDPWDMNGHGTFIAGVVAGVTNNSVGLSGIAGGWQPKNPGVRIMPLRVGWLTSDSSGRMDSEASSQAIAYAIAKGADVINMSFGANAVLPCNVNRGYYPPLATALTNAVNAGVYVTHAAGNDALDCAEWKDMITGVITVSALDLNDVVAWFSNYGTWVDLSGPGQDIYSTDSWLGTPGYATYSGTSFAAPAVAAVACLLKSQQPSLTRADLDTLIANHGENIDIYNSATYAGKLGRRPNAFGSMSALADANFIGGDTAGNVPFTPIFTDASANSPTAWLWEFGNGQTSNSQVPTLPTYNNTGYYNVSLTVTEPRGTNKHTKWNTVLVTADTFWIEPMYIGTGTDTVEIPIYFTNTVSVDEIMLPIVWKGSTFSADTMLNVVDVAGTRCAAFEQHLFPSLSLANKRAVIKLKADMGGGAAPLAPGSGVICKLRLKVVNAQQGQMACIRDTSYSTNIRSVTHSYYKYSGAYRSGCVMGGSAAMCGDANGDHAVDISDAVYLIAYIFTGGPAPNPLSSGNVNCDAAVDISDAVYLIGFIFSGGPAPCAGC
jgi:subtilisin family serine protease